MAEQRPPRLLARCEQFYRTLLYLYPTAHRRAYGAPMAQAFRDLCRDALHSGGARGVVGLCCRTLLDAGTTAAREHLAGLKEGGWPAMWRHPPGRALLYASAYLALLLPSFVSTALAWHWLVEDVLYHCADTAPIADFFPPFVHAASGDYYIAPAGLVYLAWWLFLAAVLLLPALAICASRKWQPEGRPAMATPAGLGHAILPALLVSTAAWLALYLARGASIFDARMCYLPAVAALVRQPGPALCALWFVLGAILAVARPGGARRLPSWSLPVLGALFALTVGAPLHSFLGLPGLLAALVCLLMQGRAWRRCAWPALLIIAAAGLGQVLIPLPGSDQWWALLANGVALAAAGIALPLVRRHGRRAGLPVLVAGTVLWRLAFALAYGWRAAGMADGVLLVTAVLLLVASPTRLLGTLPAPDVEAV